MATKPKPKNVGMTLPQLAGRTTRDRIDRAQHVKILQTKTGYDNQGQAYIAGQTTTVRKVDDKGKLVRYKGPKYVTMITFIDRSLHCLVSCSCSDNLFRWEVANTKRKASEVEYSNGDDPTTTNPRMNPGLCKHLYAVYVTIKSKLKVAKK